MGNRFRDLLKQNSVIVFDGAMGTVLFEHGVYINQCFDQLNLTNPSLVRDIHGEYVSAGAMVVETNTYGANRKKLSQFDLAEQTEEINRTGAQLARDATGDRALVAGSVGPLGVRIEPWGQVSREEARELFSEQISALVSGGVDLIILETFSDLAEIQQALQVVRDIRERTGSDIPAIASMTVNDAGNSLDGVEPGVFGPALEAAGADIIGMNCSVGPKSMLETLENLRHVTELPLSIMPNAGHPTMVEGRMIYLCSPDYMAGYARRFAQIGAKIVGGCCGTSPEHIRAIGVSVRQLTAEQRSSAARRIAQPDDRAEPQPPIPPAERSTIAAHITAGRFIASMELTPPHGWSLERVLKSGRRAKAAGFDAINIPDGPRASARMGPLSMAVSIERELGMETVMHYACRDRNLVGMQSDLLGAYALGLRNLLVITGDPPILSNYPNATPVFDVDAIGLTNMVTNLNTGIDLGGQAIGSPTGFWVFVALNPTAINPEKEIARLVSKVDAGAHAAITQPVFDVDQLLRFLDDIPERSRVPVVAGIWPLSSLRNAEFLANEVPGVSVPEQVLARMADARERKAEKEEGVKIAISILEQVHDRVQGIQVSAPFGRVKSAIQVLEAARRIKGEA